MDFGGTYLFDASRDQLWAALNDAGVLKAAIPGCQRLDWVSETALELTIKVNFGLLHPVFSGDLWLSAIVPAERYTLSGKGRGAMSGLAQGSAEIVLSERGNATELAFSARGAADGAIMKLGRALVGKSAQRVIDGFFAAIGEEMGVTVVASNGP